MRYSERVMNNAREAAKRGEIERENIYAYAYGDLGFSYNWLEYHAKRLLNAIMNDEDIDIHAKALREAMEDNDERADP